MAKDQYFITYQALTPPPMVSEEESRTSKLPTFLQSSWSGLPHIDDNAIDFKIKENKSVPYDYLPDELINNQTSTNNILGSVINYAESLVGIPYKFGGLSATTGTDCSGLVYLSYKQAGISVPRTVKELEKFGLEIKNINDILPGDLLCYNSSKSPSGRHVTMVSNIDNNGNIWVINAKGKKYGIIKELADLSNIKTIRRPLVTTKSEDYLKNIQQHTSKIEEAYEALLDWGYSPALASGILGNAWQESGFNILASGDRGRSKSWYQMQATERKHYANWKSRNADKIKGLPEHVTQSLYVADAVTNRKKDYNITQDLNSMTDPAQIAVIVSNQYERPKKNTANNKGRLNYAISVYRYFNTPQMKLGGIFNFINLNYL